MPSTYSTVGKTRLKAYSALFVVNIVVLALAARVNEFQGFFFMADLFPLGLSITTLILLSVMLMLDFSQENSFTARPPFEIVFLTLLSIFWLAFNAFSTSRWRHVPMNCGAIPDEFADERGWCRNVQALKAFVWIEFVILFIMIAATLNYVFTQHRAGNKQIWRTALSRYSKSRYAESGSHRRQSSFWTWEKSEAFTN